MKLKFCKINNKSSYFIKEIRGKKWIKVYIIICLNFYPLDLKGIDNNCPKTISDPCVQSLSWWQKGWAATFYSGPLTSQTSSKICGNVDFGNSGIIAIAASKQLMSVWGGKLDFEFETQAVHHFGEQKHIEFNPLILILRWKDFPWNNFLLTSLAIGDGLSVATEIPKLEVMRRGHRKCNKILNYVLAELSISLPEIPQWAFLMRYHHRSGMFGAFNGVHDASTAFGVGIRHWF